MDQHLYKGGNKNTRWNKLDKNYFEGIPVYSSSIFKGHGLALPPFGIWVGKNPKETLLKHEFGHFLQFRIVGFWKFYFFIGLPSLMNMIFLKIEHSLFNKNRWVPLHSELRVEREANLLSEQYFSQHYKHKESYG